MKYDNNLAYDFDFEALKSEREEKLRKKKEESRAKAKAVRIKMQRTIVCCISIFALCAGFMISKNVTAYESKINVEKLQKELNSLKEYSSQKEFELDKKTDLYEVEEIATNKLGMVRPEKYQTVYVNIKQDDVTEVTADEVEGINRLFNIFSGEEE